MKEGLAPPRLIDHFDTTVNWFILQTNYSAVAIDLIFPYIYTYCTIQLRIHNSHITLHMICIISILVYNINLKSVKSSYNLITTVNTQHKYLRNKFEESLSIG